MPLYDGRAQREAAAARIAAHTAQVRAMARIVAQERARYGISAKAR
jgi:hypothetical protein